MRTTFAVAVLLFLATTPALGQDQPQSDPNRAFQLIRQAEELIRAQDFAGAIQVLAEAKHAAPDLARIPFMMATCDFNLGLKRGRRSPSERAWKLLNEAIRLDPDWGEPHFFWGVMSFNTGDYEGAVRGFQSALARAYLPKKSRVNLALSLFKWGVVLSGKERPESDLPIAIRVFTDSVDRFAALKDDLRFSPEDRKEYTKYWTDSMVNLVAMLQRDERYAEAERILRNLIRIQPDNYLHHYNLGLILGGTMKNWDEALAEYRRALELCGDPDWIDPYPMIGHILSTRAQKPEEEQEAEGYFLTFMAKHPNSVEGFSRAGDHYKNTAYKRDPEDPEQAAQRADLLEKAIAAYTRCIEVDPRLVTIILKLSETMKVAGREAEKERWKALYDALKAENQARPDSAPGAGGRKK